MPSGIWLFRDILGLFTKFRSGSTGFQYCFSSKWMTASADRLKFSSIDTLSLGADRSEDQIKKDVYRDPS